MDGSEDKTVITTPVREAESGNWLSKGYVLHGRYVIEAQLGVGGFGITYLAKHRYLEDMWVAIKEYLPDGAAVRDSASCVRAVSERYHKMYSWGLHRFLEEARLLRQFNHPNIVSVQDFFEANNTAYMVMNHIRGRSLQAELDSGRVFDEETLSGIVHPLLDALQCVHREGLYHRDISPDNILLREEDDSPVLIDFGSARYAMRMHGAEYIEGGRGYTPTTVVKQGYSPIEQYEAAKQGPYTDIYALGATLYRSALNVRPVDALKRSGELRQKRADPLEPACKKGEERFSEAFLFAIDAALHLEADGRPQTVEEWLDFFGKAPQGKKRSVGPVLALFLRRNPKKLAGAAVVMAVVGFSSLPLFTRDQPTVEDIPQLLSEAGRELMEGSLSAKEFDSAQKLYLQALNLDQENRVAVSGYSATTVLKKFSGAIENGELAKAATFLDSAEAELGKAKIDVGLLAPLKQRLRLRNIELNLRQVIVHQPLSHETWSDVALLLDDISQLEHGGALAERGGLGLQALKNTAAAVEKEDFDEAWSRIAEAERQLFPFGIAELQVARAQLRTAQKEWQAAVDAKIETLLGTAEQHLAERPLTPRSLEAAIQAYQAVLDPAPEQPRARAGVQVSSSLLKTVTAAEKSDFTVADEALTAAKQAAGATGLWDGPLEETSRQLEKARYAWRLSETRSTAGALRVQALETLLAAPLDAGTFTQAERKQREALALIQDLPELAKEAEALAAGSELVALLRDVRGLLDSADFKAARNRMLSKKSRQLSKRNGLGQPFFQKVEQVVSGAEIAWNLSQAKTVLQGELLDPTAQNRARQHLKRVRKLDVRHSAGSAALDAVQSLRAGTKARGEQDYDAAVASLQEAQQPLVKLGIPASSFETIVTSVREEQEAWNKQQREKSITSKISEAVKRLQLRPFDEAAWQRSEALFSDVSATEGGSERAKRGKEIVAALKSAKETSAALFFDEALSHIMRAEKILADIGTGDFDKARNRVKAANRDWQAGKERSIAEALASAGRILEEEALSAEVLERARLAYQTAVNLDSAQPRAEAGLALITTLETFLLRLRKDEFDAAQRLLVEAAPQARSAQLGRGVLKKAEERLSGGRGAWSAGQAQKKMAALQLQASAQINQREIRERQPALVEETLREAVAIGRPHQALGESVARSEAGLKAVALISEFKKELGRNQFDKASETLAEMRRRISEARLDPAFLEGFSTALSLAEAEWLLADAVRTLTDGLGLFGSEEAVKKARKRLEAAGELTPGRPEIESALKSIAGLEQMSFTRSERDYRRTLALLQQVRPGLSGIGVADGVFRTTGQRLRDEQQRWAALARERDLNVWAGEAIDLLDRLPFEEASWNRVAVLVAKIRSVRADDRRSLAIARALESMQRAHRAIDRKHFAEGRAGIDTALSELSSLGVNLSLKNAYRRLYQASGVAFQSQVELVAETLQNHQANKATLADAGTALAPALKLQPDNTMVKTGLAVIELMSKADTAIGATEFANSAKLLNDADRQLNSIEEENAFTLQLGKSLQKTKQKLYAERPRPGEIYPLISTALEAITDAPLSPDALNTADKLLHNVLGMQSDEHTALSGLQAVRQLRAANSALTKGQHEDAKTALKEAEGLFTDIGLKPEALAPAWEVVGVVTEE